MVVSVLINNHHFVVSRTERIDYSYFCFSKLNIEQGILNVDVFISEEIL